MTQCIQSAPFLRRRNRWQDKRVRQLEKLKRWRLRKAEIRQERIDSGWRPEPKFVRAYRFEFGVRDKASGETAWHDLKSVRHAAKALGLVLKYI